jgi:hypothetical protein
MTKSTKASARELSAALYCATTQGDAIERGEWDSIAQMIIEQFLVLRRETVPVPAASRAIELAYGLLWHCSSDRRSGDGLAMQVARQALLDQLDRDGQARGIAAARAAIERSRTLSRTAPDIIAKVLEAQDEPALSPK